MEQEKFSWNEPQRQPAAGLVIVFIKTIWEIFKRIWPLLLLLLFDGKPGKESRYEIIALFFAFFAIVNSVIRFYFFRFSIINEELVIKKGWLKKETIVVPLQKIQTVHIEESTLHKVLGIVKIAIDTAGSSKTEVTIDALHRPMAEALQAKLHAVTHTDHAGEAEHAVPVLPLITLGGSDLLKLSLSANHLEALALLISFGYGLFDSLKNIGEGFINRATGLVPPGSVAIFVFLFASIFLVTIAISTTRIFLKFYGFSVTRTSLGFYIKSGLTNVKEQLVASTKVQFISWRANWVRKQLKLWLLEYKIAGAAEIKSKMKVEVPVTRYNFIEDLVSTYHPVPVTEDLTAIHIHPSYVSRRTLIQGFLPALFLISATWYWWQVNAFLFLIITLLVFLKSLLLQRKFRAFACNQVIYIDRSAYGTNRLLLKWDKVQTVTLKQSLYQQKQHLATLQMHTAGGNVTLPHIPLQAARDIVNYALYQIEAVNSPWM
ncbi:MAG: PH domain-containing protein [Chitinophagaceae bacterium]